MFNLIQSAYSKHHSTKSTILSLHNHLPNTLKELLYLSESDDMKTNAKISTTCDAISPPFAEKLRKIIESFKAKLVGIIIDPFAYDPRQHGSLLTLLSLTTADEVLKFNCLWRQILCHCTTRRRYSSKLALPSSRSWWHTWPISDGCFRQDWTKRTDELSPNIQYEHDLSEVWYWHGCVNIRCHRVTSTGFIGLIDATNQPRLLYYERWIQST